MLLGKYVDGPTAYVILVILRVVCAFFGMGYIHPDEYFQNGEVTASSVFGLDTLRTWEWGSSFPCRTIVSPMVTTGVPFAALKLLVKDRFPVYIFAAERLPFLLLSFVLDYSVYLLAPNARRTALLLLASSSTVLTFQLRPFSNSLEAIILSGTLVLWQKFRDTREMGYLSWFGALVVMGVFNRITFIAFSAPIIFDIASIIWRGCSTVRQVLPLAIPLLITLWTSALLIALDSLYFRGTIITPVVTPYNLLSYNLSSENLAQHGLHPRWLHLFVNLPMIIGPALLFCSLEAGSQLIRNRIMASNQSKHSPVYATTAICAQIIATSLIILSLQPHQEPRFLVPLVVPTIILLGNSGILSRVSKGFWSVTIFVNIALVLLFGFLHQGGVVPSLFHLNKLLLTLQRDGATSKIIFWKTYMPPRHLLVIPVLGLNNVTSTVVDLAGSPPTILEDILFPSSFKRSNIVYLVAPPFAIRELGPNFRPCIALEKAVYPHLDLDHVGESIAAGWKSGLSLGIYRAEAECLRSSSSGPLHVIEEEPP